MSDPNGMIKQRQMLLVVGGLFGIITLAGVGMFMFDNGPTNYREKPKTVAITAPGTVDDKDLWRAQQAAKEKNNETKIDEVKSQLKSQEDKNNRLAKDLEALKMAASNRAGQSGSVQGAARPDSSVLDQPLPAPGIRGSGQRVLTPPSGNVSPNGLTKVSMAGQPLNQPTTNQLAEVSRREVEMISFAPAATGGTQLSAAPGSLSPEVVGFPTDEKAARYATPKGDAKQKVEFLPAGSFVRVAMLNGVDAPTGGQAQGNPLPVAFHVLDTANLANKHRLDITDCRFVAAAHGDLSSERMMARVETLSCMINGQTVEMTVKGQVIGEDGKTGVRGRLVTKQGQLLANALFSGALSGIGRAIQASSTTTTTSAAGITQTLDSDRIAQAGLGGGLSSAANMLAQYYLKAADKLFPVIETDGGRTVEILITKGAVYTGTALAKEEYQGLLKRTGSGARRYADD